MNAAPGPNEAEDAGLSQVKRASFVVRVVEDRHGQLSGVIERAATGAKEPFSGTDVIGQVIQRMFRREGGARHELIREREKGR